MSAGQSRTLLAFLLIVQFRFGLNHPGRSSCLRFFERSDLETGQRSPRYGKSRRAYRAAPKFHNWPLGMSWFLRQPSSMAFLSAGRDKRARSCSRSRSSRWLAYVIYGYAALVLTPNMLLWVNKVAYQGSFTSTFVNHNTAATYVGAGAILWGLRCPFNRSIDPDFVDSHVCCCPSPARRWQQP